MNINKYPVLTQGLISVDKSAERSGLHGLVRLSRFTRVSPRVIAHKVIAHKVIAHKVIAHKVIAYKVID